jgi:two-component system CheB/CheR fusion protein
MAEKKKLTAKKKSLGKKKAAKPAKAPARAKKSASKPKETNDLSIVALGASAGGLKSLETFLSHLPEKSDMSYVVISHTDPKRTSLLPDILQRTSKQPVISIKPGMTPESDRVYIPPSDRDLVMEGEKFHLKERSKKADLHMPIDLFLESVAKCYGERVGCVILSGTGTDGTLGLRLVKEAGGIVLAESESSAGHYGMPKSAIDTGMVDFVLEPAQMPEKLVDFFTFCLPEDSERATVEGVEPVEAVLGQIIELLAYRTRHDFSHYKKSTLIRRITRRMIITRSKTPTLYLKYLHSTADEIDALFQDILIGVTEFFRDPEMYSVLKNKWLRDLFSRKDQGDGFRVWVAGCATGEEVYSVAMVISEYMEEHKMHCDLQLFGTDIDPQAIGKARGGFYLQNIVAKINEKRIKRFFTKEEEQFRVKKEIREPVVFAVQDVLRDPPFTRIDLLFCRNLLIYLEAEAQNRLIPLFHYSLNPGGILVLGTSESTGRFSEFFETLDRKYSIFRKREGPMAEGPAIEFPIGVKKTGNNSNYAHPIRVERPQESTDILQATERLLLQKHTPSCVIVGPNGHILHVHGRSGKYLELPPGRPNFEIAGMARSGLSFPLLTALRQAASLKKEIRRQGIQVKTNNEYQEIDLRVIPLKEPPVLKDSFMVVFEELREPVEKTVLKEPTEDASGDIDSRVIELEQELIKVREQYKGVLEELETTNEELRSANEEMHSSNEELQSTNEELESSREELESLNEELNTVNMQLQRKIEQIAKAHGDITDVLNSTKIAIIFLDNDFRIKRFTPEAARLINLIDTDIGRPIRHISHHLNIDDLQQKIKQVIDKLSPIEEEVRTQTGEWYHMRIMVYRTRDNVIDGAVLTFINIDAQKKAQSEIERLMEKEIAVAKEFSDSIVDTIRESLLVLDGTFKVLMANRNFYQTFQIPEKDVMGKTLFELGDVQWDIPQLKEMLHKVLEDKQAFNDYQVDHDFSDIGFRKMLLNARPLVEAEKKANRILLAIEDVTYRISWKKEEK